MLPDSLKKLIALFQEIPEIGPRQATRMALWAGRENGYLARLAETAGSAGKLQPCDECLFPSRDLLCPVCGDGKRDNAALMVCAKETEVLAVEAARVYRGKYFVLGEFLLPFKDNRGTLDRIEKLRALVAKRKSLGLREIVFALPSTLEGDETTEEVRSAIKADCEGVAITRLGRGLPKSGDVEYADPGTIQEAINNRK